MSGRGCMGRAALVNVSGVGSTIGNGPADCYKYCYVLAAGECVVGSNPGELYVNAPYVSMPYCNYPGVAQPGDDTNSICIGDLGVGTGNIVQVGTAQEDLQGATTRRLGSIFSRWNQHYVYWNVQSPPIGSVVFSQVRWLDGVRNEDMVSILPPYPTADSVQRDRFVAVPATITSPANQGITNAIVEFGYGENGDPNRFFCTSRQQACVAVAPSVSQSALFYYEQIESYSGVACALGCTITVPALSQHVVYYRAKFLNASGQLVYTGTAQAATVQ